jgi:hypothetical protein
VRVLFLLAIISASLSVLLLVVAGRSTVDRGGWVLVLMSPVAWLIAVGYTRVFLEITIVPFRAESNTRPDEPRA